MIRTILQIDGMLCGHCEAHVNDTIRQAFNVIPKDNTVFLHKVMSRKTLFIPMLYVLWGKATKKNPRRWEAWALTLCWEMTG